MALGEVIAYAASAFAVVFAAMGVAKYYYWKR
jgi:hypothetical protein